MKRVKRLMKFSIITLFPQMFDGVCNLSILGRAQKQGLIEIEFVNLRDFGIGRHKSVDSSTYGGGVGLVLRADVLSKALASIHLGRSKKNLIVLTSASGRTINQKGLKKLAKYDHLIIICGHYEGVDERFINKYVDKEISIGNFVLTGGEIPAMVIIDGVSRLVEGVLSKTEATKFESFEGNLLEHPHYTRPDEFEGVKAPRVLKSGHHRQISEWRREQSIKKTQRNNPRLLD